MPDEDLQPEDLETIAEELQESQGLKPETHEDYKPMSSEDFIEKQANILNQVDKVRELDSKRPKKDPHFFHEGYALALGGGLYTSGMLLHPGLLYITGIGFVFMVKQSISFLPGGDDSRFAKLIAHHPTFYTLGVASAALMFHLGGYPMPKVPLSMGDVLLTALGF